MCLTFLLVARADCGIDIDRRAANQANPSEVNNTSQQLGLRIVDATN